LAQPDLIDKSSNSVTFQSLQSLPLNDRADPIAQFGNELNQVAIDGSVKKVGIENRAMNLSTNFVSPNQNLALNTDVNNKSFNTINTNNISGSESKLIDVVSHVGISTIKNPLEHALSEVFPQVIPTESSINSVGTFANINQAALSNLGSVDLSLKPTLMVDAPIHSYVGTANWGKEISQKVTSMVLDKNQSATLTVNPPDMGPIKIVIQMGQDSVNTTFISNNVEVRQALHANVENLRQMMSQAGMTLGQTQINSGNTTGQNSFESMTQNNSGTGFSGGSKNGSSYSQENGSQVNNLGTAVQNESAKGLFLSDRIVDTFA
jgi:flagellar hook-length control protein FliK